MKNKENLIYFENNSMRALFKDIKIWQVENQKRLLSTNIEKDGDTFCCIALTNPSEVRIVDRRGNDVTSQGRLKVIIVPDRHKMKPGYI